MQKIEKIATGVLLASSVIMFGMIIYNKMQTRNLDRAMNGYNQRLNDFANYSTRDNTFKK